MGAGSRQTKARRGDRANGDRCGYLVRQLCRSCIAYQPPQPRPAIDYEDQPDNQD